MKLRKMGRACSMHGRDHICIISGRVIKMVLNEMGCKGADWIHMAQWWDVERALSGATMLHTFWVAERLLASQEARNRITD
jgi:hypothetical protein